MVICRFHGCPTCWPQRDKLLVGGKTADQLHQLTLERVADLERLFPGIEVELVWECQFMAELEQDKERQALFNTISFAEPINPRRDALRGGRVEMYRPHYTCSENEQIYHADVCSLYPTVMKTKPYPVGNPTVLGEETFKGIKLDAAEDLDALSVKGLLSVTVLPPTNLRLPVLPYRTKKGVLAFPLCRICAEREQKLPCEHSDHQRALTSTFTHFELRLALTKGYVVLVIHEVS